MVMPHVMLTLLLRTCVAQGDSHSAFAFGLGVTKLITRPEDFGLRWPTFKVLDLASGLDFGLPGFFADGLRSFFGLPGFFANGLRGFF